MVVSTLPLNGKDSVTVVGVPVGAQGSPAGIAGLQGGRARDWVSLIDPVSRSREIGPLGRPGGSPRPRAAADRFVGPADKRPAGRPPERCSSARTRPNQSQ